MTPLTGSQLKKVHDWLKEKNINSKWPLCNNGKLEPDDDLIYMHLFDNDKAQADPSGLIMVQITCNNCGYAQYFRAKKMGLTVV